MIFEVFPVKVNDSNIKEWEWRLRSRNGQIIANCAESYKRKSHALSMIEKIAGAMVQSRHSIKIVEE